MNEVQFSYSITKEDYAEANALICKKSDKSQARIIAAFGVLLIAVPFFPSMRGSLTMGLLPWLGLFFILYGLQHAFPRRRARRYYARTGLAGVQFTARISAEGLWSKGRDGEWKYGWPTILLAEESDNMFAFYTGIQLFPFAKRFLTAEQIETVRQLIAAQPGFPGITVPRY